MDNSEDKWIKLEQILRTVVREEHELLINQIAAMTVKSKKPKVELVGGRFIGITPDLREAWGAAYGSVNLDEELDRAAAWCVANPMKAPRSQLPRFLNAWMAKEQNRASIRSIPAARPTAITPSLCEYCRKPSTGAVSGRRACAEHFQDAMDGIKPAKFMPGVVAKLVVPE